MLFWPPCRNLLVTKPSRFLSRSKNYRRPFFSKKSHRIFRKGLGRQLWQRWPKFLDETHKTSVHNQKTSKEEKIFKRLHPQLVPLDTKIANWTKLRENFRQKSINNSVEVGKIIDSLLFKKIIIRIFLKTVRLKFWQPCQKILAEVPMTFWSKSWSIYRKSFSSETTSISFSSEHVSCSFDNHNFFWNDKTLSTKNQAKVKIQVFFKQISSTESFRHVESSFDNLAPQNILKVFDPNHKTLEKVYSVKKDINCIKSSSSNAKCKFGNPAESS